MEVTVESLRSNQWLPCWQTGRQTVRKRHQRKISCRKEEEEKSYVPLFAPSETFRVLIWTCELLAVHLLFGLLWFSGSRIRRWWGVRLSRLLCRTRSVSHRARRVCLQCHSRAVGHQHEKLAVGLQELHPEKIDIGHWERKKIDTVRGRTERSQTHLPYGAVVFSKSFAPGGTDLVHEFLSQLIQLNTFWWLLVEAKISSSK